MINENIIIPTGIAIVGSNGSGKTTLGASLSKELNYKHMDIENYYFLDSKIPYSSSRSKEDVQKLIQKDIESNPCFILTAVNADLGEEINSKYDCIIYLKVPDDIRLNRVKQRSYDKFGDRVLQGGDMYEQEQRFFEFAAARTMKKTDDWIKKLSCPILYLDGTKPIADNVKTICCTMWGEKRYV